MTTPLHRQSPPGAQPRRSTRPRVQGEVFKHSSKLSALCCWTALVLIPATPALGADAARGAAGGTQLSYLGLAHAAVAHAELRWSDHRRGLV